MSTGNSLLGTLGSGEKVFDRIHSHAHKISQELLAEALAKIIANGEEFLACEVDFGRTVGESVCVATKLDDEIVYAQRIRRCGLTRFVKNRQAEPTKHAVIILKKRNEGGYLLITAFVGRKSEHEPWDKNAGEKSLEFWKHNALIWGSEPVVSGTETKECPW